MKFKSDIEVQAGIKDKDGQSGKQWTDIGFNW